MSGLPEGRVVSLQIGLPREMRTASNREWRSAIVKEAVTTPVRLGAENFVGDYQANRKYHGGPDKAVCFYSREHYALLGPELGLPLGPGAFGENLTVTGLPEESVCIGDTLQIGAARLQVSQPRQPCANVSKRWAAPTLPRRMEETGWTGFYCRVLEQGDVAAGDTVVVVERPNPDWSLRRANDIMYAKLLPVDAAAALRDVPLLSAEWRRILNRKLTASAE